MKKFLTKILIACTIAAVVPVSMAVTPLVAYEARAEQNVSRFSGDSFTIEVPNTTDSATYKVSPSVEVEELKNETVEDGDGFLTTIVLAVETPGQYTIDVHDGNGALIESCNLFVADEEDIADGQEDGGDTEGEEIYRVIKMDPVGGSIQMAGAGEFGNAPAGAGMRITYEADDGWEFRRWVIRDLNGVDVTDKMGINDKGEFLMPDYSITITAVFEYTKIESVEIVGATTDFEVGDKFVFTGKVVDETDPRYFILAEIWTTYDDSKGLTSSEKINKNLEERYFELIDTVEKDEAYLYSVIIMANDGYIFSDDVTLTMGDLELTPDELGNAFGVEGDQVLSFSGIITLGEPVIDDGSDEIQTVVEGVEPGKITKDSTKIIYKKKEVPYTTYEYVTVMKPSQPSMRMVRRYVSAGGTLMKTRAAATGDASNTAVWIALAIAGASGLVSGIAVAKRRKRGR